MSELLELVERLRAWSPMIASGYECPAAAQPITEAADTITAQAAEIAALRERVRGLTAAAQIIVGLFDAQTPEQKKARPVAIDKALREFRALLAEGGEK